MARVVTAVGALVKIAGRLELLHRDAPIPAGADEEHVQLLVDRGLVGEGEGGGVHHDPATPPPFKAPAQVDDDPDGDGPIPPKSAPKEAWVAYAASQGADEAEAAALTKDALIEKYGAA